MQLVAMETPSLKFFPSRAELKASRCMKLVTLCVLKILKNTDFFTLQMKNNYFYYYFVFKKWSSSFSFKNKFFQKKSVSVSWLPSAVMWLVRSCDSSSVKSRCNHELLRGSCLAVRVRRVRPWRWVPWTGQNSLGILIPPSPRSPSIPDLFCSRFRKSADCQTKAALVSVGLRTAHARAKALTCPQGSARPRQRPKRRGTMWRCGTGPTCSGGCITLTLGTRSFRWSCGCRWVSASPLCAWSSLSGSEADVSRNDLSLSVLMCTFRRKFKLKEMKTGRIVQVLRSAEETCDDDQMTHSSVVCYRRGKLIIFTTSDTCQTSPKASL